MSPPHRGNKRSPGYPGRSSCLRCLPGFLCVLGFWCFQCFFHILLTTADIANAVVVNLHACLDHFTSFLWTTILSMNGHSNSGGSSVISVYRFALSRKLSVPFPVSRRRWISLFLWNTGGVSRPTRVFSHSGGQGMPAGVKEGCTGPDFAKK